MILYRIMRRLGRLRCIYCHRRVPWRWARTRGQSWGIRTLRTCCETCARRIAMEHGGSVPPRAR